MVTQDKFKNKVNGLRPPYSKKVWGSQTKWLTHIFLKATSALEYKFTPNNEKFSVKNESFQIIKPNKA